MQTITVREKSVYGNTHMYISDAYFSGLVSHLTGKKTVAEQDLQCLSKLGFRIEVLTLDGFNRIILPKSPQGLDGVSDSK